MHLALSLSPFVRLSISVSISVSLDWDALQASAVMAIHSHPFPSPPGCYPKPIARSRHSRHNRRRYASLGSVARLRLLLFSVSEWRGMRKGPPPILKFSEFHITLSLSPTQHPSPCIYIRIYLCPSMNVIQSLHHESNRFSTLESFIP